MEANDIWEQKSAMITHFNKVAPDVRLKPDSWDKDKTRRSVRKLWRLSVPGMGASLTVLIVVRRDKSAQSSETLR